MKNRPGTPVVASYGAVTPIGRLVLGICGNRVCRLWLPNETPLGINGASPEIRSPQGDALAQEAFEQLSSYLAGRRKQFDLPLYPFCTTPLQEQIRRALCAVPYGSTVAYKDLGPPRAVARVCSQNPLPLIIPCHRVVPSGSDAEHPGQYRGGTALKRQLLQLEALNA